MKKICIFAAEFLAAGLILAFLAISGAQGAGISCRAEKQLECSKEAARQPFTDIIPQTENEQNSGQNAENTEEISIYCQSSKSVVRLDMQEYITGVVAAEMPSSYGAEALKAQAVAARTYFEYKRRRGGCGKNDSCAVCTASGHCQAYADKNERRKKWGKSFEEKEARIQQAVRDTQGEIMTFGGEVVLAMYHDSSFGSTEAYRELYSGGRAEYLQSVFTPEKAREVKRIKAISCAEFAHRLMKKFPDCAVQAAQLQKQLKIEELTASGRVKAVRVGKIIVSGSEFEAAAGLRSTLYSFNFSAGNIIFTNYGYGHGVGMSQRGAAAMAKEGKSYEEILLHYYKGVTIENIDVK